jgi:hypothetical protein
MIRTKIPRNGEMIDPTRDRLLLACVKGRWDAQAREEVRQIVDENDVDWDGFCVQVGKHSMAPLIYHTLRDDDTILPLWVKEKLQSAYYQSARRNTLLYQELDQIVHVLNDAKIPVILLKGAALAIGVYGNIALRPMADIDLLVRKENMSRTEELFLEHGYEIHDHADSYLRHATFTREDSGWPCRVEVHRHMVSSAYYRRSIPEKWLWPDPIEVIIDNASSLRLSPDAAIFHASLHVLDHIAIESTLLWLWDIVEISQCHDIDWDTLADRTIKFKIVLPIRSMLLECKELLDLPIPDDVLERMFALGAGFLEKKAYQFCLSPVRSSAGKTFLDLFAGEGLSGRFRLLSSRLFPSRDYMMARYSIRNARLVPLYYPYMIAKAVLDSFRALARSQLG